MPRHHEEIVNSKEPKSTEGSVPPGSSVHKPAETTSAGTLATDVPDPSTHKTPVSDSVSRSANTTSHTDSGELLKRITTLEGEIETMRAKLK